MPSPYVRAAALIENRLLGVREEPPRPCVWLFDDGPLRATAVMNSNPHFHYLPDNSVNLLVRFSKTGGATD